MSRKNDDEIISDDMAAEVREMAKEIIATISRIARESEEAKAAGRLDDAARLEAMLSEIVAKARELGIIPPDPFDVKA